MNETQKDNWRNYVLDCINIDASILERKYTIGGGCLPFVIGSNTNIAWIQGLTQGHRGDEASCRSTHLLVGFYRVIFVPSSMSFPGCHLDETEESPPW